MKGKLTVHVEHFYQPDPEAVRSAIEALIRLSDEARAKREAFAAPDPAAQPGQAATPDPVATRSAKTAQP